MLINITYVIFGGYIVIRIILSILYAITKSNFKKIQNDPEHLCKESLLIEGKKMSNRWRYIHKIDVSVKRIIGLILAGISLYGIFLNYQFQNTNNSLQFAMLPGLLSIFNVFFEWFEVKLPIGVQELKV